MEARGIPVQQEGQQLQILRPEQPTCSLLMLHIEVIQLKLLPYLENGDRCNLFDSCWYLRPLKQTELTYKFNKAASVRYAIDFDFREQVHRSAAMNPQLLGKRMIDIDISNNLHINDVSMLGEVMTLNLSNCDGVRDVTALGIAQMLNLTDCSNILLCDALIRRTILALRTTIESAATASSAAIAAASEAIAASVAASSNAVSAATIAASCATTAARAGTIASAVASAAASSAAASTAATSAAAASNAVKAAACAAASAATTGSISHAKHCAAYTLASLISLDRASLIAEEGGIEALLGVLIDDSNCSSAGAKQWAAAAIRELFGNGNHEFQMLMVDKGIIDAMATVLKDASNQCNEDTKFHAANTLQVLSYLEEEINDRNITRTLIALLKDDSDTAKRWAAWVLIDLCEFDSLQQLLVEEGGIPALVALLTSATSSADAKTFAADALKNLAELGASHALMIIEGGIRALFAVLNDHDHIASSSITSSKLSNCFSCYYRSNCSSSAAVAAALALENYFYADETIQQLIIDEGGGISGLIDLLADDRSADTKQGAAYLLKSFADFSDGMKHLIADAADIPALVAVLLDTSDRCSARAKQEAAFALTNVVVDNQNIEQLIRNEAGMRALVTLLRDVSQSRRTGLLEAEQSLTKLAASSEIIAQLIANN